MRSNGGLIGTRKTVNTSAASGIWAIRDAQREHGISNWPSGDIGDFRFIATSAIGAGGVASVTFSSIPQTYKHLQIRWFSALVSGASDLNLTYNSDTASNYKFHILRGQGSGSGSGEAYTNKAIGSLSTIFKAGITDILDYTHTSKNKVARTLFGVDENGAGEIGLWSHLWLNTSAITLVTLTPGTGTIAQHSSFALYGIMG